MSEHRMPDWWEEEKGQKWEYFEDPYPGIYTPLTPEWIKIFTEGLPYIDKGLLRLCRRLNEAGYYTVVSCSGLTADHRIAPKHTYIEFVKTDKRRFENIIKAASSADLLLLYSGRVTFDAHHGRIVKLQVIVVRSPRNPKSDREIHESWRLFEESLFT